MGKLSVRFALMLAVALLPLGLVSLFQTWSLKEEAQARTEAALFGETLRAATVEVGILREVQGMVSVMAGVVPAFAGNDAACIAMMRAAIARAPVAAVAGFVQRDGTMSCASTGKSYQFSNDPVYLKLLQEREPGFYVNRDGPVSGTSVLGLSNPVFRDGEYIGYVGVSLRHDRMLQLNAQNVTPADLSGQQLLSFWTFDDKGEVLTGNIELDAVARNLPVRHPLTSFVGGPATVFRDRSESGVERTFALVPLVSGKLYLMSSWSLPQSNWNDAQIAPYLPTILMFAVGLMIAASAAEGLVIRHVRALRQAIGSFTRGDRRLEDLDLRGAPEEIHQLGEAYLEMTDSVTRGEARLEDGAHQKDVLLREVHHRVKNNLQLISSIISIQLRRTHSDEAKGLLKGLQDRVISLATVHRELYQTSGLADVRADELFPDIVRQIINVSVGSDAQIDVESDIDDLRLVPDQAVPLSLLLAEALTNALKHSGFADQDQGGIRVRLKRLGGSQAVLQVTNGRHRRVAGETRASSRGGGVGSQLMAAFATQLGGTLETESSSDHYTLTVTFTVRPLAEGEGEDRGTA